ncbi:RdgB/HAM1 family non-canonical purine NTP pyrophosphatase [Sphaerisporangium fuscum]|uniref:RdgB/HAM1 family non-canonical purine NTP pyrophosphatase n=1 Tax=Sphaerisporangium fuscum TaxID=2835868 RepID=UPI001BDC2CD0|nr:RdgB/HAM1 family non-canonical purine NTP pyrophosphatase [Sphaerisporangium fuscum]
MSALPKIVLATRNQGKIVELRRILAEADQKIELVGLEEFPQIGEVAETGLTFAENALLKAHAVAAASGLPAVADDSGLCVDALNGMPGVFSARWAGSHGDDEANLRLLLAQVSDVPDGRRQGHFACAAALALPSGEEHVVEGTLTGTVIRAPRGTNGFGYDPIFVPEGESRTTAEMAPGEKDAISHRGRAFRALAPVVREVLAS